MSEQYSDQVTHVVLTGGPGGGKTTSLQYLQQVLTEHDYISIIVPEAATMLASMGLPPQEHTTLVKRNAYTLGILDIQAGLMDGVARIAEAHDGPIVVVHDRGVMDTAAYYRPQSAFADLPQYPDIQKRSYSYKGVIHLQSAAVSSPQHYHTNNNHARHETVREAAVLDQRILEAWSGHPGHWVIESCDDFEHKKRRVGSALGHILGWEPEIERKFLLKDNPFTSTSAEWVQQNVSKANIVQFYTHVSDKHEIRYRSTEMFGVKRYHKTEKTGASGLVRQEKEYLVTASEFEAATRGRTLPRVEKQRFYFTWGQHRFEVDQIIWPMPMWLLEIELIERDDQVIMPGFLTVEKETTGQREFSMAEMAKRPPG